jgi:hypothetical protein
MTEHLAKCSVRGSGGRLDLQGRFGPLAREKERSFYSPGSGSMLKPDPFSALPSALARSDDGLLRRVKGRHLGFRPKVGTLNLTQACRYRHFEPDPPASSVCPRSREQCGQMFSSLSFALLGRAMMPARRLSLSR